MKEHNKNTKKTNAARLLDSLSIPYTLQSYEVDEEDLSALHVAQVLGIPAEHIYKTLVARGDKTGVLVCCIPGPGELDLKALAQASGNKKADLVPLKELLALTGYIRGGCSPLGMKKLYPTYIDEAVLQQSEIMVSAGQRGLQLKLAAADLVAVLKAKVCSLCH
ncbi:MAG: Cys-tRNA(Pro) deacylase [Clostridiales bacterium]